MTEQKTRMIGIVINSLGDEVLIDHVYDEPGEDGEPDEGLIGLMIREAQDEVEARPASSAGLLLDPEDALVLANRLVRAANLVLESREGTPDFSREYRRLTSGNDDAD